MTEETEDYIQGFSDCYQEFKHVLDDMTRVMDSATSTMGLQNAINMFIMAMHVMNPDTRFTTN